MTLDFAARWKRGEFKGVRWVHPSYRDLVINELAQDEGLKLRFLRHLDLEGIKLALSEAGGPTGERRFPLMTSKESWAMLRTRCLDLVNSSNTGAALSVLRIVGSATLDASIEEKLILSEILAVCCSALRDKWDLSGQELTADQLKEYFEMSVLVDALPLAPRLGPSWRSALKCMRKAVADSTVASVTLDAAAIYAWAHLTEIILDNEPRYLRQVNFPIAFLDDLDGVMRIADQESSYEPSSDHPDELYLEAERLETIESALQVLTRLFPESIKKLRKLARKVSAHEARVRRMYYESADDDQEDYDPEPHASDNFDVEKLFIDL